MKIRMALALSIALACRGFAEAQTAPTPDASST